MKKLSGPKSHVVICDDILMLQEDMIDELPGVRSNVSDIIVFGLSPTLAFDNHYPLSSVQFHENFEYIQLFAPPTSHQEIEKAYVVIQALIVSLCNKLCVTEF